MRTFKLGEQWYYTRNGEEFFSPELNQEEVDWLNDKEKEGCIRKDLCASPLGHIGSPCVFCDFDIHAWQRIRKIHQEDDPLPNSL